MWFRIPILLILPLVVITAPAQFHQPQAATSEMYFPQLAYGGGLQTTLTVANSNRYEVWVEIFFYQSNGDPWGIDFGEGPQQTLQFAVPGSESRSFEASSRSPQVHDGWGQLYASSTVLGVATYGGAGAEISVPGTLPSITHVYPASSKTALAVGNVFNDSFDIQVEAIQGSQVYRQTLTLPALGHRAFFLDEVIQNIPDDFQGIVDLSNPESPPQVFAALGIRSDGSTFSSLPNGTVARPQDHCSMIWDVFLRIVNEIPDLYRYDLPDMPNPETITLDIGEDPVIDAWGSSDGIQINLALAELISDSESELAFVIGRELGHVYQDRTGRRLFHENREWDADVWGLILSLVSGYDPYGAAGALAKLTMAAENADLVSPYLQTILTVDGSFKERIQYLHNSINELCDSEEYEALCEAYRVRFHPHLPTSLSVTSKKDRVIDLTHIPERSGHTR